MGSADTGASSSYRSHYVDGDGNTNDFPEGLDREAAPGTAAQAAAAKVREANDAIKDNIYGLANDLRDKWNNVKEKWEAWKEVMMAHRTCPQRSDVKYTFAIGAWCSNWEAWERGFYDYWRTTGGQRSSDTINSWDERNSEFERMTNGLGLDSINVDEDGTSYTYNWQYGGRAVIEYGKMPWANFSFYFACHYNRMVETMDNHQGGLPDLAEVQSIETAGDLEAQEAFIDKIFEINHDQDVNGYLQVGTPEADGNTNRAGLMYGTPPSDSSAASLNGNCQGLYGCPALELLANPFGANLQAKPNFTTRAGTNYKVAHFHASIIFNGWVNTTGLSWTPVSSNDHGNGCGTEGASPLKKISVKSKGAGGVGRMGNRGLYRNRPGRNPFSGAGWADGGGRDLGWQSFAPEWTLKWNEWPTAINAISDELDGGVSYPVGVTDFNNRPSSIACAAVASKYTLLGTTFFGGSFAQPEIMYWWNQRFDIMLNSDMASVAECRKHLGMLANDWDDISRSDGGSTYWFYKIAPGTGEHHARSFYAEDNGLGSWTNPTAVGISDTQNLPQLWKRQKALQNGTCPKSDNLNDDINSRWNHHGHYITARESMRGEGAWPGMTNKNPGGGDLIGQSDWDDLKDAYFNLKSAIMQLRAVSSEILQLDCDRFVAQTDLRELLEFYLDPNIASRLSEADRETLQAMLDDLEENADSILTNTSDYTRTIIFKEQCFLLANISPLASWYKSRTDYEGPESSRISPPYWRGTSGRGALTAKNAPLFVDGDSYAFFNKLSRNGNDENYYNATEAELSGMQPLISLFKVEFDPATKKETEVKINFDSFADRSQLSDLLTNRKRRGFGVGVKSFDFKYAGSNPFSARRSIQAKLIIFANSFDELLMERTSLEPAGKNYRYVDLALKTRSPSTDVGTGGQCANVSSVQTENINMAKLNFRLKAIVGWSYPNGHTRNMSDGFKDAMYDSFVTLNLTPTVHSFDFDDMGRVTFEINYLAYVDDFLEQPLFSIFANQEITKKQILRELTYTELRRTCAADRIETMKDTLKDEVFDEKRQVVSELLGGLITQDRIYHIVMSYEQIRTFTADGPFLDPPIESDELVPRTSSERNTVLADTIDTALDQFFTRTQDDDGETARQTMRASLTVNNPNQADIPFFFAGDLITDIMRRMTNFHEYLKVWVNRQTTPPTDPIGEGYRSNINICDWRLKQEEIERCVAEYKKFRAVLGPVEIVDRTNDTRSQMFNLADLPISTKYFMEFLTEKLAEKEQAQYQLSSFLNDFFNSLLRNFLNNDTCFKTDMSQRITMTQAALTSYRNSSTYDEITHVGTNSNAGSVDGVIIPNNRYSIERMTRWARINGNRSILNISGVRGQNDGGNLGYDNMMNYMFFFAGRLGPPDGGTGRPSIDTPAGVWHYSLGRDRGIVKNITLQKTQTPGLQEVRFEQEGYDGLSQLRVVYDVEIECYANVKAFPGQYIFVNPQGFAPSTSLVPCSDDNLTRYGIGGYYMIITSEHSFAAGQATTKIVAKWVASVDTSNSSRGDCGEGGLISPRRCNSS